MEYLFEFILEIILESSIEVSKNRKISKWIRYPLIVIISFFFLAVIGLVFLTALLSLKENIFLGIFFLIIGIFLFVMSIVKFRKTYLIKTKKK